ncbi:hypothetical protein [Microbacterium paludicola]|uniref:hypothetical protein n=1 Tax=Microbacterium paludicola TaxID=300019 RepID=UPI0011A3BC3C|nr:hypothetical protein [Microbacterium paludicola]
MARTLSVEEAEARANQLQQERLNAIRGLAEARQNVVDAREDADRRRVELERELAAQINDAERADVQRYNAALSAGWTEVELRKIGFDEPEKKQRTRKRRAPQTLGSRNAEAKKKQDAEHDSMLEKLGEAPA